MVSRVFWSIISKALKVCSTLSVTIKMVFSIGVMDFNGSRHIATTCGQMQVATECHDLVHLRACLTCFILENKGSLGTMATEYNDSFRLIRDRIWQSSITGKTLGIILSS